MRRYGGRWLLSRLDEVCLVKMGGGGCGDCGDCGSDDDGRGGREELPPSPSPSPSLSLSLSLAFGARTEEWQ